MLVFQLSDILPISKILLLDAALARIALFDCEAASLSRFAHENTDIGILAKAYSHARNFLFGQEWKYVMEAAGHLARRHP